MYFEIKMKKLAKKSIRLSRYAHVCSNQNLAQSGKIPKTKGGQLYINI